MRLLRTMLFTPGNSWRMIQKAKSLPADAVILDLEDAVPIAEKETARFFVKDGVQLMRNEERAVYVRVNSLSTGLTGGDLEYSIQEGLNGIVLPKTESGEDVLQVDEKISKLEEERLLPQGKISIIPLIETAKGVVKVEEIIKASERVTAVCFGALDYTRDMGTAQSEDGSEVFYARSKIALVARANDVQAIDTPWLDLIDAEGLVREASLAKKIGFKGKLLIHPDHIEAVNKVFTPSREEVEYARKVVKAFMEAEDKGLGAVSLDGKMIDKANFVQAESLLNYAKTILEKEKVK